MKLPTVGTEKCPCTERCNTYFLTGIGRFVQGSGFDKDVAEEVAMRLNAHDDLVAALKESREALGAILEDTDGDDGERVPNPLLVQIRAALAKAGEK